MKSIVCLFLIRATKCMASKDTGEGRRAWGGSRCLIQGLELGGVSMHLQLPTHLVERETLQYRASAHLTQKGCTEVLHVAMTLPLVSMGHRLPGQDATVSA